MNDTAKNILSEMNQSLHEKIGNEFRSYLINVNQNDKIARLGDKIDWKPLLKLFETEYIKLWIKIAVPEDIKELNRMKIEFQRLVLANIKQKLFYFTFMFLKDQLNSDGINVRNLNSSLYKLFENGMSDLFGVFEYQFTLLSLKNGVDPKPVIKQINELQKKVVSAGEVLDNGQHSTEEKVFKMIDEQLLKNEKEGRRWSIRAVCDLYASNELKYGRGKAHQIELDNFFIRYQAYNKKVVQ